MTPFLVSYIILSNIHRKKTKTLIGRSRQDLPQKLCSIAAIAGKRERLTG